MQHNILRSKALTTSLLGSEQHIHHCHICASQQLLQHHAANKTRGSCDEDCRSRHLRSDIACVVTPQVPCGAGCLVAGAYNAAGLASNSKV